MEAQALVAPSGERAANSLQQGRPAEVFGGFVKSRTLDVVAVAAAIGYMLATGWAMMHLYYDVWGAMIAVPLVIAVGVWVLNRIFVGEFRFLYPIAVVGLLAKMAGTLARYWVVFDAYAGQSDAVRYHEAGKILARKVRDGRLSIFALVPREVGTAFLDRFTGFVYTVFGSSQLAGFVLFSFLSYWGLVLFVKAGIRGIPGLAQRRYAWFCFLTPSVIFWPSSIGKEAWMCFCLGLASWGSARLLTGLWRGATVPAAMLGLIGAGFVRPHMAALWTAGVVAGLIAGFATGRTARGFGGRLAVGGRRSRLGCRWNCGTEVPQPRERSTVGDRPRRFNFRRDNAKIRWRGLGVPARQCALAARLADCHSEDLVASSTVGNQQHVGGLSRARKPCPCRPARARLAAADVSAQSPSPKPVLGGEFDHNDRFWARLFYLGQPGDSRTSALAGISDDAVGVVSTAVAFQGGASP